MATPAPSPNPSLHNDRLYGRSPAHHYPPDLGVPTRLKNVGLIIIGILCAGMGLKGFLLSADLRSGFQTLDFVLTGIEEYTGVTSISLHSEAIRRVITEQLGRSVTLYKGESGYGERGGQKELNIVFTVVTRLELPRLRQEVKRPDAKAFLVQQRVDDAVGVILKPRPLH